MENASKALLIAGAILLVILIIAIGMYIYSSAESNIRSSVESMSTQEKDAFNSQWTIYDGAIDGAKVKTLLGRLISNASTYQSEASKVPGVNFSNFTGNSISNANYSNVDGNALNLYVTNLSNARAVIQNKHTYTVVPNYGKSGLIESITITF